MFIYFTKYYRINNNDSFSLQKKMSYINMSYSDDDISLTRS